jgi:hypothetical protein
MSTRPGENQISHGTTIKAFQRALDQAYRQLLESAKADWQLLFAGTDPSDACVRVRVSKQETADELAGMPRAGFLQVRKNLREDKFRPRLA